MNTKSTLLFFLIFLWAAKVHSQQLIELAPEVYKSYQELKGAYENFDKVQSIVKDIEKGNKPNIASYGSDWAPLANRYKQAAETIKNAKLITDFDATQYTVSLNDLNNCYIKDQNFAKLKSYQSQLEAAVARGQKELLDISDYKKLIDSTFTALNYLIEVNKKLASVPIYNEIFQWNWLDLDQGVHPALGDLSSAINAHEKKLKQEVEKVKAQSTNLASNTTLLQNSLCNVAGVYRGNGSDNNGPYQTTLSVVKNGSGYSGQVVYANNHGARNWVANQISISSNGVIVFNARFQNLTRTFRGTLNSNFRIVQGFHSDGETSSCNLSK